VGCFERPQRDELAGCATTREAAMAAFANRRE
jgi:hypothetical protein